jgi:hypothetical protein
MRKEEPMIKTVIISVLVGFFLCGPANTNAQTSNSVEGISPTPSTATILEDSQSTSRPSGYLNEWYIVGKISSVEGLAIGVFWFHERMSKQDICSRFGNPQDTLILYLEGYYHGSILLYPNHYFFLSSAGHLQTVIERP